MVEGAITGSLVAGSIGLTRTIHGHREGLLGFW